jgi:hypothetical protein
VTIDGRGIGETRHDQSRKQAKEQWTNVHGGEVCVEKLIFGVRARERH